MTITPRQRQVVVLLVQGRTYPQIAHELRITTRTVRQHVADVAAPLDGHPNPRYRVLMAATRLLAEAA